jgi:hypothetical protein
VIVKEDVNKSNHPIHDSLLFVTESRTRDILVSEVVMTVNTWYYIKEISHHFLVSWKYSSESNLRDISVEVSCVIICADSIGFIKTLMVHFLCHNEDTYSVQKGTALHTMLPLCSNWHYIAQAN